MLGVGSGSRLTLFVSESGMSVPFSVGSSCLDKAEGLALVGVEAAPLLLLPLLPPPLPTTSLWKSMPIFTSIISGEPWTRSALEWWSWPKDSTGVSEEPLSFLGLPLFLFGAVNAEPKSGWLDIWWNLFCEMWWWGPIWFILCRFGGGGGTVFWLLSNEDVMLGRSHLSSFTSVRPFILRDSATLKKAVSLSWSTLTSPRYMKSRRLLISTYGTSFRMTIGCLSGCPTNKA